VDWKFCTAEANFLLKHSLHSYVGTT